MQLLLLIFLLPILSATARRAILILTTFKLLIGASQQGTQAHCIIRLRAQINVEIKNLLLINQLFFRQILVGANPFRHIRFRGPNLRAVSTNKSVFQCEQEQV